MTTTEDEVRHAVEEDPASRLLEQLVGLVAGRAGTTAVFGDAVERDGITVIPVARVRWGVGGGGGRGPEGTGSGGGGGAVADPVGYIELTSNGATFRPLTRLPGAATILIAAVAIGIVVRAVARLRG
jgi:uncharacterized spore protein YtfJ